MRVSVIIPTLNEAANLGQTLATIPNQAEAIICDGGSTDETQTLAKKAGATIIEVDEPQRARQMNAGAKQASGDILLFLHADTKLPKAGIDILIDQLKEGTIVGGCFARRFDHPSPFLAVTTRLAGLRSHIWGWIFGDQAMFARKDAFEEMGGFREWSSFEDLDFSQRMRKLGKTIVISKPVISSGRRFERHGPVSQTIRDLKMTYNFMKGKARQSD